jgi:hypothetical protein
MKVSLTFTRHFLTSTFGYAFALCLITLLISCENKDPKPETIPVIGTFYDFPDKLWAHRSNDIDQSIVAAKVFPGLEIDVFFDELSLQFTVHHDEDDPARLSLGDYLDAVVIDRDTYVWIDFKNLDKVDHQLAVAVLHDLIRIRNMGDRIIVESWDQGAIQKLHNAGLNTSYWLPHFEDRTSSDSTRIKKAIEQILVTGAVDALSADQIMYEFLDLNFPESALHLWTNGLEGEEGKGRISQLAQDPQVKVILVDYKENFLQLSGN